MTAKNQEEQSKTVTIKFTQNVKYKGVFYSAGTKLDIPKDDEAALIKDGVINSDEDEDDDDQ